MVRKKLPCIAAVAVLSLGFCVVLLLSSGCNVVHQLKVNTNVVVHDTLKVPREEVTAMLVADDKVFLFYDATGLINVYTTEGAFCYGLQVKSSNNGKGDIAYRDGKLYINSRENVIYAFSEQELIDMIAFVDDNKAYKMMEPVFDAEKSVTDEEYTYYLLRSVDKVARGKAGESMETIIELPRFEYGKLLIMVCGAACLVFVGLTELAAFRARKQ